MALNRARREAIPMSRIPDSIVPGDKICFSAGLLQDIHQQPEHTSVVVRVLEVRSDLSGVKTLVLQRVEP